MEGRTAAVVSSLQSTHALESQAREAHLERRVQELEAQHSRLQLDNTAVQRRIDLLKLEREELQQRVDALDYQHCELREHRARFQQSLALLESKEKELEAQAPQRLLVKFAKGAVRGALGAMVVLKLGGFVLGKTL